MSAWGVIVGIAAVLAVVVTSLVIAVCLAVAWVTDAVRATRGHPQRGVRGGGSAQTTMPSSPAGRHRYGSGVPYASRRGDR